MSEKRFCPVCSEGHLVARDEERDTEYKGHRGTVRMKSAVCNNCGVEIAGPAESLENKRAMIRFRKGVERLLTGKEIHEIRKLRGLTQVKAAELFGGGPVAFSKYEHDDMFHSRALDLALRLVKENHLYLEKMMELKGIEIALKIQKHGLACKWDMNDNGMWDNTFDVFVKATGFKKAVVG